MSARGPLPFGCARTSTGVSVWPGGGRIAQKAHRFASAALLGASLFAASPSSSADASTRGSAGDPARGSAGDPVIAEDPFGGRPRPAAPAPQGAEHADPFDQATVDGVYGRFDGDLSLAVGLGGELGFDPASPRLLGTLALRYYSLVGLYAGYRESLRDVDPQARGLSVGLLLEPLFLLRWTRAATTGSPFWDLTIDSLGLSFGAHLDQPEGGSFASSRGFELGLGAGVPLLARAGGPWLRAQGQLRWVEDGAVDPVLWLTLEWRTFFESGLPAALGGRP